jgi:hypothetical protein
MRASTSPCARIAAAWLVVLGAGCGEPEVPHAVDLFETDGRPVAIAAGDRPDPFFDGAREAVVSVASELGPYQSLVLSYGVTYEQELARSRLAMRVDRLVASYTDVYALGAFGTEPANVAVAALSAVDGARREHVTIPAPAGSRVTHVRPTPSGLSILFCATTSADPDVAESVFAVVDKEPLAVVARIPFPGSCDGIHFGPAAPWIAARLRTSASLRTKSFVYDADTKRLDEARTGTTWSLAEERPDVWRVTDVEGRTHTYARPDRVGFVRLETAKPPAFLLVGVGSPSDDAECKSGVLRRHTFVGTTEDIVKGLCAPTDFVVGEGRRYILEATGDGRSARVKSIR